MWNCILTHKRFKIMLNYYDTDTKSANFRGNPLRQPTKRHLTVKRFKKKKKNSLTRGISTKICRVRDIINKRSFEPCIHVFGSCFRTLASFLFQIFITVMVS